jgi:hypothetical protein
MATVSPGWVSDVADQELERRRFVHRLRDAVHQKHRKQAGKQASRTEHDEIRRCGRIADAGRRLRHTGFEPNTMDGGGATPIRDSPEIRVPSTVLLPAGAPARWREARGLAPGAGGRRCRAL